MYFILCNDVSLPPPTLRESKKLRFSVRYFVALNKINKGVVGGGEDWTLGRKTVVTAIIPASNTVNETYLLNKALQF